MRRQTIGSGASALLLLATVAQAHKGSHEQLQAIHKRHRESRITKKTNESQNFELEKRGGQCVFPSDAGLVAVTPGSANAGWAMSPDQSCTPGMYCPYACPPGQVSMQWDPSATAYSYPQSMVSDRPSYLEIVLILPRTVVCTAIQMGRSQNLFQASLTVNRLQRT